VRRAIFWAFLLLLASILLGATVFRDQIANATGSAPVTETNIDSNGFIRVHEQGTANVSGTFGISSSANTVSLSADDRAKVDLENQHLANIDAQTAKLNFDGDGNLKTSPQGTQTVHVDNTSLTTAPPAAANFEYSQQVDMDAGSSRTYSFSANVHVSLVVLSGVDDTVDVGFRNGTSGSLILRGSGEDGADQYDLPLTQPIPVNNVFAHCGNTFEDCKFFFMVVGSTA